MCWISCRDTSVPSDIPSSSSTVCVRIGGSASGRPASAAPPTANIAPEISPPGSPAQRNSRPPAAPITSVSSVARIWARSGMADAIDAGIRGTPPYGKSGMGRQMRHAIAAMRKACRVRGLVSGVSSHPCRYAGVRAVADPAGMIGSVPPAIVDKYDVMWPASRTEWPVQGQIAGDRSSRRWRMRDGGRADSTLARMV